MEFGVTEGKRYWVTLQDKSNRTVAFEAGPDDHVLDAENTDPIKYVVDLFLELGSVDDSRVRVFVEDYFYPMSAAMLMPSDRAVAHFHEWLSKGANYLQYGNEKGYELKPAKSQWRKAQDGETVLPGDPK
jgi:hypothetical protein